MYRKSARWSCAKIGIHVVVLMLAVTQVKVPEAFAFGPLFGGAVGGTFGGEGFGGGAFAGGGFNQGGGYPGNGGPGFSGGGAGQMFIYPSHGQSPQQEQYDKGQCYGWAVQQTGFDPANPQVQGPPPPQAGPPQGGLLRGGAGGAAMGAIGGAIGGNTGEGAAIGAAAGGLFGAIRRRRWEQQEQSQQSSYMEQQQNALSQGRTNFNQAFATCMTGRGYTVGG